MITEQNILFILPIPVMGLLLNQERLRLYMFSHAPECEEPNIVCYLLDDGAFIIVSSEDDVDARLEVSSLLCPARMTWMPG